MGHREKAETILAEVIKVHYPVSPAPVLAIEALELPSCGLMGDDRVYGYAWNIYGIPNFDAPHLRAFLHALSHRLTAEVVHDNGTRFVRVFAEVCVPGG